MDTDDILSISDRLELRNDRAGPRHYLHDRRVDEGDMLDIAIKNHCWLRARYEGPFPIGNVAAVFSVDLAGHNQSARIFLPDNAAVCWPIGPTPPRYDVWDPWDLDDDEDQGAGGLEAQLAGARAARTAFNQAFGDQAADDVDADRRQAELDKHRADADQATTAEA